MRIEENKKTQMKCLVLAGGYDQIALITALQNRGIEVILVDYYENPPAKKVVEKHYRVSTLDIEIVEKIARNEKVDLVTTACTDQALLTVAKVSETLDLPCYLTYEEAINVTNKAHMKEKMLQSNIPTARYQIIDKQTKLEALLLNYPVVVKPVDCNSSKGVKKVLSVDMLQEALSEAMILSRTGQAIVEEYKQGIEVSIDVYIENGNPKILCITETEKIKNEEKFIICGSKYPVSKYIDHKEVEYIAKCIAETFNLKNSPLLIQAIVTDEGLSVLEFSPRIGGGTKYKLIQTLSGVDIMNSYVACILGEQPTVQPKVNVQWVEMKYCYCYKGYFRALKYFLELSQQEIITDYFQYKPEGVLIENATSSGDRVAGYLIVADTQEMLQHKKRIVSEKAVVQDDYGNNILIKEWLER